MAGPTSSLYLLGSLLVVSIISQVTDCRSLFEHSSLGGSDDNSDVPYRSESEASDWMQSDHETLRDYNEAVAPEMDILTEVELIGQELNTLAKLEEIEALFRRRASLRMVHVLSTLYPAGAEKDQSVPESEHREKKRTDLSVELPLSSLAHESGDRGNLDRMITSWTKLQKIGKK